MSVYCFSHLRRCRSFSGSVAAAKFVRELPSSQNERPAFAAIGSIHTEKQSAAPARRIGLVRPRVDGLLGASTSASTNWAGYDIAGGTYTSATATWIQPSVQPDYSVDAASAFWVGIDGVGTRPLNSAAPRRSTQLRQH